MEDRRILELKHTTDRRIPLINPYADRDWRKEPPKGYVDAIVIDNVVYGIKSYPIEIGGEEIYCLPSRPVELWCPIHGAEDIRQRYVEYGTWYMDENGDSCDSEYMESEPDGEPWCDLCGRNNSELGWCNSDNWFKAIVEEDIEGIDFIIDLSPHQG